MTPVEGFAVLLTSTRTWPAGNSFPKKSFVSLAKSQNLAKQKKWIYVCAVLYIVLVLFLGQLVQEDIIPND